MDQNLLVIVKEILQNRVGLTEIYESRVLYHIQFLL